MKRELLTWFARGGAIGILLGAAYLFYRLMLTIHVYTQAGRRGQFAQLSGYQPKIWPLSKL